MAKHKSIDHLCMKILADVLADFTQKGLGSDDLYEEYVGVSLIELERKFCTHGGLSGPSKVDFDLALKQLEENGLIGTGPTVAHENRPDSLVVIIGLYSKREFAYLTEEGYREAKNPLEKEPYQ